MLQPRKRKVSQKAICVQDHISWHCHYQSGRIGKSCEKSSKKKKKRRKVFKKEVEKKEEKSPMQRKKTVLKEYSDFACLSIIKLTTLLLNPLPRKSYLCKSLFLLPTLFASTLYTVVCIELGIHLTMYSLVLIELK